MRKFLVLILSFRLVCGFVIATALTLAPALSTAVELRIVTTDDGFRFLLIEGVFQKYEPPNKIRALIQPESVDVVVFNSEGGNVRSAISFGREIRSLGLSTLQPRSLECASACSLAFMGGRERSAMPGAIGMHRSSFAPEGEVDANTAVSAVQQMTAEIMLYMTEMGVDPELMQLALSYDAEDMRYLSLSEMEKYRVVTNVEDSLDGRSAATVSSQEQAEAKPLPTSPGGVRLALYRGLDFYGSDLGKSREADTMACALKCIKRIGCVAFTYNANQKYQKGPNCFIKSDTGRPEYYEQAFSGIFVFGDKAGVPSYGVSLDASGSKRISAYDVLELGD